MKDLEKFYQIEKQLNAKKRENLKKAYEVLGRKFYKKSHAKNLSTAEEMLGSMAEYEKLGRKFYKQSHAKSMSEAFDMLTKPLTSQTPTLTEERLTNLKAQEEQLINLKAQLQTVADGMVWTGKYWVIDNLPEVSNWLSQFRKKENDQS